jgi:hypothetical protein
MTLPIAPDPYPTSGRSVLARHLQQAFAKDCPRGWACSAETPLFGVDAAKRLGFWPRADVLLQRTDGARRIWVEFEVSRADPVANQAKFASAAFFEGYRSGDAFVSMASRHIAPGRKALMASTAMFMRAVGIPAFQIDLLPDIDGRGIKALNVSSRDVLAKAGRIDMAGEIERVIAVGDARLVDGWHRIHMSDNAFTVGANIRTWNAEMSDPVFARRWGGRRVKFLAFDPASEAFAPSKFCAFIPATDGAAAGVGFRSIREPPGGMTSEVYFSLGEQDPRFDGHVARMHLERRLRYRPVSLTDAPREVAGAFEGWVGRHATVIAVDPDPVVLVPPDYSFGLGRGRGAVAVAKRKA